KYIFRLVRIKQKMLSGSGGISDVGHEGRHLAIFFDVVGEPFLKCLKREFVVQIGQGNRTTRSPLIVYPNHEWVLVGLYLFSVINQKHEQPETRVGWRVPDGPVSQRLPEVFDKLLSECRGCKIEVVE